MQLVVDNLVKKTTYHGMEFAPGNRSKKIIAPPRIVLLQNSSKFLALHHFDIATLSTSQQVLFCIHNISQEHKMALSLRGPRVAIYNYHVIYM